MRSRAVSGARANRQVSARRAPPKQRSPARVASHAARLAEQVRRLEPPPAPLEHLDGDYAQAIADGAVDEARRRLEKRIRAHMPRASLQVRFTDNRYTMISVRRDPKEREYRLRVHHMFADAEPGVTRALAHYICHNDGDASRMLGEYIDEHQHRVRPRRAHALIRCETTGEAFDLREIFDDLNRRYFDGGIDARITWGARTRHQRRRNSIKMGSYSVEERLIRIHRTLDRPFVPRYFLEWIVYHEMLHQVHEALLVKGRRRYHTPAFNAEEARFDRYPEARAWERAHIEKLLDF